MVKNESNIYSVGFNPYGQIIDGTTIYRSYPVKVQNPNFEIVDIAAGYGHTLILKTGGTLFSIGYNNVIFMILIHQFGQLGVGNTATQTQLTLVSDINQEIDKIYSYSYHSFIMKNGSAYGFGYNPVRFFQFIKSMEVCVRMTISIEIYQH
jgi:alpha-tubulin suppressor-like RCC1 family protein